MNESLEQLAKTQHRMKRILAAGAVGLGSMAIALGIVVNQSVKNYENARLVTDWEQRSGAALKQFETNQIGALLSAIRVGREILARNSSVGFSNLSIMLTLRTLISNMQERNEFNFSQIAPLQQVSLSPDGEKIAIVGSTSSGEVQVFDRWGQPLAVLTSPKIRGIVPSFSTLMVSFSPDSQRIASIDSDEALRLWDLSGKVVTLWKRRFSVPTAIKFSPDGKQIVICDTKGTIQRWDLTGKLLSEFKVVDLKSNQSFGFDQINLALMVKESQLLTIFIHQRVNLT